MINSKKAHQLEDNQHHQSIDLTDCATLPEHSWFATITFQSSGKPSPIEGKLHKHEMEKVNF